MSDAYGSKLVDGETTALERVATGVVGLGIVSFVLGMTSIFRWTTEQTDVLGISLFDVLAVGLLAMGVTLVGIGVASRAGLVETQPDRNAGVFTAVAFGGIGAVAAGLVVSQTLGVGAGVSLAAAVAAGAVVTVGVMLVGEDVGSTVPVGLLTAGVGALVLTGVLGPEWSWDPDAFTATFYGTIVVPALTVVCGLLCSWSAAKSAEGFGTRGRQNGAYLLIGSSAFGMLAVLAGLILFIVSRGLGPVLEGARLTPTVEWPFVTNGFSLSPTAVTGVYPAIVGTFWVVFGAVVLAVPIGIGAAVFLSEYAEQGRFTAVVEVATNGLWSTPSVVFGLFGYAFLVPRLGNNTSLLAGMLVLGFMLLPLVVITSREALLAVPDEYRDASAALGVSQWQTIRSVVVPAAMPGIATGIILGVGRIAGETAPILLVMTGGLRDNAPSVLGSFEFTGAPPFVANDALLQSAPALPYQLYATITAGVSGDEAFGWGTALVLLLVVLSFYAIGIASRIYFRRKLTQ
ncbi:phosphate ABC transporter permease PstA [Halomarina ordinaria]|uniref:Phosphate transport system permease protein PstA n=1 Tax=Halomarina ordinaria TaxID=3033939 RepID=A0ABD5U938_9EURY|nr:phosphate ABC transporter permease PstA [Halomarina sp. PSRA2]